MSQPTPAPSQEPDSSKPHKQQPMVDYHYMLPPWIDKNWERLCREQPTLVSAAAQATAYIKPKNADGSESSFSSRQVKRAIDANGMEGYPLKSADQHKESLVVQSLRREVETLRADLRAFACEYVRFAEETVREVPHHTYSVSSKIVALARGENWDPPNETKEKT